MKSSAVVRSLKSVAPNGRVSAKRPELPLDTWARRAIARRASAFSSHAAHDGLRCW